MSPTNASQIGQDRIIGALRAVWSSLDELLGDLAPDEWRRPSPLPGWDVQANVAHIMGTEAFLLGAQPDVTVDADSLEHVHNPIGAMNEGWVASYADREASEVHTRFRELTRRRLSVLESMSADEWNAVGFTPAGQDAYGRFMQIRVFDCWMHEQDIRAALDRPGHDHGLAVEVSLDEMTNAMGFVVGKRAGAPAGSSVTFELTGPTARTIHVDVGERAIVVPHLDEPATATLTIPAVSFGRICGGRLDAPRHVDQVVIDGDESLGTRVLQSLAYTI